MTIIDIDSAIEQTLAKLNKEAGGDAQCYVAETGDGPALFVESWSGSKTIGMTSDHTTDPEEVADILDLDDDLYYAWTTGSDNCPTLAAFDDRAARDQYVKDATPVTYEIWLVPNGRAADFRRGRTDAGYPDHCELWGSHDIYKEALERFRELAEEEADRRDLTGDQATAYVDECVDSKSIEWHNDLKWVWIVRHQGDFAWEVL